MKPIFLWLMFNGSMLSLAMRVKSEGYPIKIWISSEASKVSPHSESGGDKMGEGIIDKDEMVKDYWEVINKHTPQELLIIVDDNGGGQQIDMLRKLGYKVIGGGSYVDKLEHDRGFGNEIAAKIGLRLPKTFEFTSLRLARKFISKLPEETKFVFKASGSEYAGSAKTYTSKNITDLTSYLDWLYNDGKEKHYQLSKFELQQFVDGKEADFSAWFDGDKFIPGSTCLTFEVKKVGDSEYKPAGVGQAAGCMGQTLFYLKKTKYEQYFDKLAPILKESGYIGQVAINNIVADKDGQPYFLEFTPRFGFDSIFGEMQIRQDSGESIAKFFIDLINKTNPKFNYDLISTAARIYCCTPGHEPKDIIGRLFTFDELIYPNLWFYSVSLRDTQYIIENGVVLVAATARPKLQDALTDLYKSVINKLNISDIYYRSSIGKEVPETVEFLKKQGWL